MTSILIVSFGIDGIARNVVIFLREKDLAKYYGGNQIEDTFSTFE